MKNIIFSFLLVLISFNGYSQTTKVLNENKEEEFIRYDATGLIYYKDELYTGFYEKYHENGQPYEKGSYKNGQKDGVWEEYHMNGQLSRKGSYINGKKNGVWEGYHENGQLKEKGPYLNWTPNGVWERY